ncbi:hypothetical protein [Methylocystis parvus]|uniref:hypothetical protein n=1 Tax=Methylocystis parvus TaxID=134 RepID=UPI003C722245
MFGNDVPTCGSVTSPCRTFQYAHDNIVVAGGTIQVRDPGGYGPLLITKAIAVINDGVGGAGVFATSGQAIIIAAGASDAVILKGLTINGANLATHGVNIVSAGSIAIANCTISGFVTAGLNFVPTALVTSTVFDTIIAGNGTANIRIAPNDGSVRFLGRNVNASNAQYGILIDGAHTTGVNAYLENSAVTNNGTGVSTISDGTSNTVFIGERLNSSFNSNYGLWAQNGGAIRIMRSSISRNGTWDVYNQSGPIQTLGDNYIVTRYQPLVQGALE